MTIISIDNSSVERLSRGFGCTRKVPEAEIAAVASACAKLLDELGSLGHQVEVLEVTSWHAHGRPNLFEVKAVLSINRDKSVKVEAKCTFEHFSPAGPVQKGWDLDTLSARIVSDMKRSIHAAVRFKIDNIKKTSNDWEMLLPKSEKV